MHNPSEELWNSSQLANEKTLSKSLSYNHELIDRGTLDNNEKNLNKFSLINTENSANNKDQFRLDILSLNTPTTIVSRSNSVPFKRNRLLRITNFTTDNSTNNKLSSNSEAKIPLVNVRKSRKISTASSPKRNSLELSTNSNLNLTKPINCEESSKDNTDQCSATNPAQKWNKLRTVMTMTAAMKPKKTLDRQDSFIKKFTTQRAYNDEDYQKEESKIIAEPGDSCEIPFVIPVESNKWVVDPQGKVICIWLGLVTMAVLYNLWTSIARQAFVEILIGYEIMWIFMDVCADLIYLLDIVVQLRTSYLERGLRVFNLKKLGRNYLQSKNFIVDCVALLPLDFLQFITGFQPLLRFPRFLKVYRAWAWKIIMENRTIFPNLWRVVNLTHILFLGCHWFAAFYFLISQVEGFKSAWGYPKPVGDFASVTRKYLKSFYWSTLTLTTIGDLPAPEQNWEYVFTIVSYLIGVFVFATIVGQVGNVITNRNANRLEFEKILDNAKNYMRVHNVPNDLQKRVMRWYDYAWSRGRTSGCSDISSLALLPDKLKTEMALHVNLETLKKVTIFQECNPEFLHDLVLKMKPFIFTPGDLICRRGEVAREMFIISDGVLEIISDSGDVLKQMGSGDFFGEIGILNLDGGINRRSADVKSVGYSELFVLSKEDVLTALKDHPDAEKLIIKYGTWRLNEMKDRRIKRNLLSKYSTSNPSLSSTNETQIQPIDDEFHKETLLANHQLIRMSKELEPVISQQTSSNSPVPEIPNDLSTGNIFKNIIQKIKLLPSSSNSTCRVSPRNSMTASSSTNSNNCSHHQSIATRSNTCDNCALAKLANNITHPRNTHLISPSYDNKNSNNLSLYNLPPQHHQLRINSVPSIENHFLNVNSNLLYPCIHPHGNSIHRHSIQSSHNIQTIASNTTDFAINQTTTSSIQTQRPLIPSISSLYSVLNRQNNLPTHLLSSSQSPILSTSHTKSMVYPSGSHFISQRYSPSLVNRKKYEEDSSSSMNDQDKNIILSALETILSNYSNSIIEDLRVEVLHLKSICQQQQQELNWLRTHRDLPSFEIEDSSSHETLIENSFSKYRDL